MPSKQLFEIIALKNEIDILNKKIDDQIPLQEIKNITIQEKKDQPYGLIDLIAGKTATFTGWTVNPTDAKKITDGSITTFCTTGNDVANAWETASFEWDLGDIYPILITGFGKTETSAGTGNMYIDIYDGINWYTAYYRVTYSNYYPFTVIGCKASKIRLSLSSTHASTNTPNIREVHVWRLQ